MSIYNWDRHRVTECTQISRVASVTSKIQVIYYADRSIWYRDSHFCHDKYWNLIFIVRSIDTSVKYFFLVHIVARSTFSIGTINILSNFSIRKKIIFIVFFVLNLLLFETIKVISEETFLEE